MPEPCRLNPGSSQAARRTWRTSRSIAATGGSSVGSTNRPQTSTLCAVAVLRDLEPVLDRLGAGDQRLDVGQLVVGEGADVRAGVGRTVLGPGERRDLVEAQAGALRDVDDREAVEDLRVVAALAADAVRAAGGPRCVRRSGCARCSGRRARRPGRSSAVGSSVIEDGLDLKSGSRCTVGRMSTDDPDRLHPDARRIHRPDGPDRRARRRRTDRPHGHRARACASGYATRPRSSARTRELVAAESSCCAFLDFTLGREDDAIVLDISGPEDARPVIDLFFAPDETVPPRTRLEGCRRPARTAPGRRLPRRPARRCAQRHWDQLSTNSFWLQKSPSGHPLRRATGLSWFPPRTSSAPPRPAPASPLATSGPRPPGAPSSRPLAALPTRGAPASRWLARSRRRR